MSRPKRRLNDPRASPARPSGQSGRWWCRYRLLLLAVGVCIVQILVGLSFLHSYGHQHRDIFSADELPPDKKPEAAKEPGGRAAVNYSCTITSKEALSAISRATTAGCKQDIADFACALQNDRVYPKSLPSYCRHSVDEKWRGFPVGCYQDNFSKRLLQGNLVVLKLRNSPKLCVEICGYAGFAFAGVQYGSECFCGNSEPDYSAEIDRQKCDMPCDGEPEENCGGYLTMNVFKTGVRPLVPNKTVAIDAAAAASRPVKIVFLLTINGRAARQVRRLIKSLMSPEHYFLVHVDSRQSYLYREMSELAGRLNNLRLTTNRFSTIWGGASLLQMLLSSMEELLTMDDWDNWDFVLNLSESDYPIKKLSALTDFLSSNRNNNFVKSHGREPERFLKKQGLDKSFFECDTHMWRIGSRTLPWGVQIDGGSDWVCLSRQFVGYVVRSSDELITGLKRLFRHTLLPAESFFHTVLRNSQFCGSYVDNNLHITNWKRKLGCKCQYKAVVDWCGCSPNDFLPDDWPKLESTLVKQVFFGRKFEPVISQAVINKVDRWIGSGTGWEQTELSYWQNVHHWEDSNPRGYPPADPALLAVSESLARTFLSGVIRTNCLGDVSLQSIQELTTFNFDDAYNGTLVFFGAETPQLGREFAIELNARPVDTLVKVNQTRVEWVVVSSEFDPKELVFRNFFRALGPGSRPSIGIRFGGGSPASLSVGWQDPAGNLVAVDRLQLNETSGLESIPLSAKPPHRPGQWTVYVIQDEEFVATLRFLVLPLWASERRPTTNTVSLTDPVLSHHVRRTSNQKTLAEKNEQLVGSERLRWLDRLVKEFYSVSSACAHPGELCQLPACQATAWSSRYPDPKSTIE